MRWLPHIFKYITCNYQTATPWDLPPYWIAISLNDDAVSVCLLNDLILRFCYSNLTQKTGRLGSQKIFLLTYFSIWSFIFKVRFSQHIFKTFFYRLISCLKKKIFSNEEIILDKCFLLLAHSFIKKRLCIKKKWKNPLSVTHLPNQDEDNVMYCSNTTYSLSCYQDSCENWCHLGH